MLGGLQGCQNRGREGLGSAGEDVKLPSAPEEGARAAQRSQSGGGRAVMVAKSEPRGAKRAPKRARSDAQGHEEAAK